MRSKTPENNSYCKTSFSGWKVIVVAPARSVCGIHGHITEDTLVREKRINIRATGSTRKRPSTNKTDKAEKIASNMGSIARNGGPHGCKLQ